MKNFNTCKFLMKRQKVKPEQKTFLHHASTTLQTYETGIVGDKTEKFNDLFSKHAEGLFNAYNSKNDSVSKLSTNHH